MLKSDFHYELPESLIAQFPPLKRGESRLLYLDGATGEIRDLNFNAITGLIKPGDLIVFNDTKVIPARIYGHKSSGGKVEVLVERFLDDGKILAHIKASKSPKPGTHLVLGDLDVTVSGRDGDFFILQFPADVPVIPWLECNGHMPLPPYIKREDEPVDKDRYQTVYAKTPGAVAAPTAGLHFDHELLSALKTKGVETAFVTLHVGAGTFQPVRVDNIREHQMHAEYAEVSPQVCAQISATKSRGGRVIAVGSTSVRCLETAVADDGHIKPFQGLTRIFIKPGSSFHVVDIMITNFHLPESTLLMLVCAFAGYDQVMNAYRHAVEKRYRFFSYGDAMFITKKSD